MRPLAAVAFLLAAVTVPAGVEAASRLYPFAGVVVRFESHEGRSPDALTLAQAGFAVSLGKIAPSVVVKANTGHLEAEVGLRYSFR